MKQVAGLNLTQLVAEAEQESLTNKAKEIKRLIMSVNDEIINRSIEIDKLEAKLKSEKARLEEAKARKDKIASGDWGALKEEPPAKEPHFNGDKK